MASGPLPMCPCAHAYLEKRFDIYCQLIAPVPSRLQAFLLFNQSFAQSTREAKAAKKLAKVLASQGAAGSKAQADPSQVVKDLNHAALTIAPTPTGKREESRIKSFLARFESH